jgi:AcrR family transcriptional regulator
VELLDADGVEGLSMRLLGARLGSAATAVYWHVKNKDDLMVLAADSVWSEIDLPDIDESESGWRSAAARMAHGLYAMVLRHPWLVPAMSTHLLYGPGKARHDDHMLAVYEASGFTGQEAAQAAQVVFTFVLGSALGAAADVAWRARMRRAGGDVEEQVREVVAQITEIAMRFPRLRAHGEAWADDPAATPDHELEFGLETILAGLEARLAWTTEEPRPER